MTTFFASVTKPQLSDAELTFHSAEMGGLHER